MTEALYERRDDGPFDGDHLRELVERAARVKELTEHPGWEYLRDYVIALTTPEQRYVLLGKCKDDREYTEKTARVAGMLDVLEAPVKLQERVAQLAANRPQEEPA